MFYCLASSSLLLFFIISAKKYFFLSFTKCLHPLKKWSNQKNSPAINNPQISQQRTAKKMSSNRKESPTLFQCVILTAKVYFNRDEPKKCSKLSKYIKMKLYSH